VGQDDLCRTEWRGRRVILIVVAPQGAKKRTWPVFWSRFLVGPFSGRFLVRRDAGSPA